MGEEAGTLGGSLVPSHLDPPRASLCSRALAALELHPYGVPSFPHGIHRAHGGVVA